jgi:hypothetical protein
MITFLFSIIAGAVMGIAIYSLGNAAKATGRAFSWWHWVMACASGLLWVTAFAWLGSQLGEGASRGGWIGFALVTSLALLFAILTWRLLPSKKLEVNAA